MRRVTCVSGGADRHCILQAGGSPEFRHVRFHPSYVRFVLNQNFEDAKALLLEPLMAIHHAHLVMLAEQGIVTRADARAMRDGAAIGCRSTRSGCTLRRHLRGPVLLSSSG